MLVLHSHLPFVKHPEYEYFLEEHWLYEAINETYIPFLMQLKKLEAENVFCRITVSLTPPLCEMLADGFLMERYARNLDKQIDLAQREIWRTRGDSTWQPLAEFYYKRFKGLKDFLQNELNGSILQGYRYFQSKGMLEIITCGATHGFLPFINENPKAVYAQLKIAVDNYVKHFGLKPRGIWLPECAYYAGLEDALAQVGLRYFFMDTHGILYGKPQPRYGVFAPVFTGNGVAAFGRDYTSSKQVWSAKEGYPGDPDYRDFYRDIGYDLDFDYIAPYVSPDGIREFTGIKYYRITGDTNHKEPYNPQIAQRRTQDHARHFVAERKRQAAQIAEHMQRPPLIVSPYDAELFGHWWFEGPEFLGNVFRGLMGSGIEPITPMAYFGRYPTNQVQKLNPSSWGNKGYYDVWLGEANDWIYRHLHHITDRMTALAAEYAGTTDANSCRMLNQMARELLLAQSSDWAFLIDGGTATDYSIKRTKTHIYNFLQLEKMLQNANIDFDFLQQLEFKDSIFQELDFRVFA